MPLFPQTATAQLYLCEGLEAILKVIAGRLKTLIAGVETRRAENGRIAFLAHLLTELEAGRPVDTAPLMDLAEEIVADAQDGGPLLFREGDPARPAHFVACHGLTTARVIARVVRDDLDWDAGWLSRCWPPSSTTPECCKSLPKYSSKPNR